MNCSVWIDWTGLSFFFFFFSWATPVYLSWFGLRFGSIEPVYLSFLFLFWATLVYLSWFGLQIAGMPNNRIWMRYNRFVIIFHVAFYFSSNKKTCLFTMIFFLVTCKYLNWPVSREVKFDGIEHSYAVMFPCLARHISWLSEQIRTKRNRTERRNPRSLLLPLTRRWFKILQTPQNHSICMRYTDLSSFGLEANPVIFF